MLNTTLLILSLAASPEPVVEAAPVADAPPTYRNAFHLMPLVIGDQTVLEAGYEGRASERATLYLAFRGLWQDRNDVLTSLLSVRVQPHYYFYGTAFNGLYAAPVASLMVGNFGNKQDGSLGRTVGGAMGFTLGMSSQFGRVTVRLGLGPAVNVFAVAEQQDFGPTQTSVNLTGDLTIGWLL